MQLIAIIGYLIIVVIIIAVVSIVSNLRNNEDTKRRVEEQWGKKSDKKYNIEELNDISGYFYNIKQYGKGSFFIDEITWNDLEMDEVFRDIDTTFSTAGEEIFYAMLREPVYNDEKLQYRNKVIEYFRKNSDKRKTVQYIIAKLGRKRGSSITNYFYNQYENEKSTSYLNVYRIFRVLPIASVALIFLNKYLGVSCIILCFVINIMLHYFFKKGLDYKLRDFTYITKVVKCGNAILRTNLDELGEYNDRLKNSIKSIKNIKNLSFNLENNGSDIGLMMEYMNILFLTDLINYEKMNSALRQKSEDFRTIYSIIGNIDSYISIASYRDRVKNYVVPKLRKCNNKQGDTIIIKDMVHPLIDKAVANSLKINDSILITGSNASGKSTFLKTLALNIIFSQTICTCTASYFEGCYLKIYTSMALRDNIFSKESYYVAETKSLKRIIDSIGEDIPTICFVDEILRGTNTIERIAASSQILKYLTLSNCICIAATHDIELTHILEDYFENYHFQENIVDNEIMFDYKIHDGRSTTQNAIKLLSILGYKQDIVNKAEEKAKSFLKDGIWETE